MKRARHLAARVWYRLASSRVQREIDDELQFHLDMRAQEYRQGGEDPRAARTRARRRFGSIERVRRACSTIYGLRAGARSSRGTIMRNLWQDLRYAVRSVRRQPSFSAVAVLTLAAGMAASTVIFSAVHSTLLQPTPFPDGDRLARVWHRSPTGSMLFSPDPVAVGIWRERATTIEAIATYGSRSMVLHLNDEPHQLTAGSVSPELVPLLGIAPVIGRAFLATDTIPGQDRVVMLAYHFWQQEFGEEPDVLHRTLVFDDTPYTVIGVLPRVADAHFSAARSEALDYAVWVPGRNLRGTIAKLREDVGLDAARQEFAGIYEHIDADLNTPAGWEVDLRHPNLVSDQLRTGLFVLLGAVAFVLLAACVNVANMLLVRGVARGRELALRQSLGAGRVRMVRQMLAESLVLTTIATGLSFPLTLGALHLLRTFAPEGLGTLQHARLDAPVLGAAIAVAALITVGISLVPLGQLGRLDLARLLSTVRTGHTTRSGAGLRNTLVALEVATATVLFIGAGLMVRTLYHLQQHDPGFEATSLIAFRLNLPEARYGTVAARQAFVDGALEQLRETPAVEAAAVGAIGNVGASETEIHIQGAVEPTPSRLVLVNLVSEGFFRTVGTPLRGRGFTRAEINSETRDVIVVNEDFERMFFAGESALGRRFRMGREGPWRTIVGVAADVRISGMSSGDEMVQIYRPYPAWDLRVRSFLVRTSGPPLDALAFLKGAIWTLDPTLPLHRVELATGVLSAAMARPRFNAGVLGAFAVAGLVLAAVGVYSVVSLSLQSRRHEIGVRMALGAGRRHTVRLMLGYGLKPALVGAGVGLLAAGILSRFLRTLLYEVTALDPGTYAVVLSVLIATALVASLLPARRAMRVDPVEVLRAQ